MNLLVISPRYPFPPETGGTLLAYHHLKELAKRHTIHFICTEVRQVDRAVLDFLDKVEVIGGGDGSKWRNWWRVLIGAAPSAKEYKSKTMAARIAEIAGQFDAMILYELIAAQYCPPGQEKKAILNIEDPSSIKLRRLSALRVFSPGQRVKLRLRAWMLRRYEDRVLPTFGRVVTLSGADMHDLSRQLKTDNIGKISYGVAQREPSQILAENERVDGMIVYSGNMNHPPNVDGALYFLGEVFPLVQQKVPSATVWIVGANPDPRIVAAAAPFGRQVTITGRVEDTSEYIRRAKVSVCPVRLKIGVQTKILEAMSWGTPVVSTASGNSGISGVPGEHLWTADSSEEFAGHVAALLSGRDWTGMSARARAFVGRENSWELSAADIEREIATAQGRHCKTRH